MLKRFTLSAGALAAVCAILYGAWVFPESTPVTQDQGAAESEESDWPEFVSPLLEANALQQLAGAPAEPFREALNRADERTVRDGFTEYVFHNRVVGDAEGPCTFRITVDERRECPTIIQSDLQCPEW